MYVYIIFFFFLLFAVETFDFTVYSCYMFLLGDLSRAGFFASVSSLVVPLHSRFVLVLPSGSLSLIPDRSPYRLVVGIGCLLYI